MALYFFPVGGLLFLNIYNFLIISFSLYGLEFCFYYA